MAENKVATKSETNVVPFDMSILKEDIGVGMEGVQKDDILMPRLSILQQMSDQVNSRHGDYVEGAQAGYIYDNVSKTVTDGEKGITVVPITYRRAHIEWKPNRGGLVKDHGSASDCLSSCTRGELGEYFTDEGNQIVITGEFLVYVIEDTGYYPALISMSNSQFAKAKQWNAMSTRLMVDIEGKMENPALFYTAYELTSVPQSNDKGSWFGWSISMKFDAKSGGIIKQLPNGGEIYLAARKLIKDIKDGSVTVKSEQDDVM